MKKEEDTDIKLAVGKQIVAKLSDEIFTVDGTPMVTRKTKEEGYRQKPLVAGAEFMLTDAYVGTRKNLIFILTPADGQDYTIEVEPRKIDNVFVEFGSVLGQAFGIDSERSDYIANKLFAAERERRAQEAAEREKEQFRQTAETYDSNPLFGRF